MRHLSNQFHDTTRLLDLLFSIPAEVTGADDNRDFGNATLAKDLRVAEGEEVDNRSGIGLLAAQVGFALLSGYEGPELYPGNSISKCVHCNNTILQISILFFPIQRSRPVHWRPCFPGYVIPNICNRRTLSRLIVGFQYCWLVLWKYLIPTLPK